MEFDTERFKSILEAGGKFLVDMFRTLVLQIEEQAYQQGMNQGVKNGVAALCESGIEDEKIIALLNKYWNIPYREAQEKLQLEKRSQNHIEGGNVDDVIL